MNWKNFVLCGLTGWCMEILFTSFGTLMSGNAELMGHTSIWMFPIYGMAALIGPIYHNIAHWHVRARGCLYAAAIMVGEFLSGSVLRFFSICPWDYSGSPYSIYGLVRLDYFPVWIIAGLVFERLLCWQGTQNKREVPE